MGKEDDGDYGLAGAKKTKRRTRHERLNGSSEIDLMIVIRRERDIPPSSPHNSHANE